MKFIAAVSGGNETVDRVKNIFLESNPLLGTNLQFSNKKRIVWKFEDFEE